MPARLMMIDGNEECWINDISLCGARVSSTRPPSLGETVILKAEGLDAFGSAVWVSGEEAGILFDGWISKDCLLGMRKLASDMRKYREAIGKSAAYEWACGR